MAKNTSPFDLNFPPVNFELDGSSDPIEATLQLSRSHDENHITSAIHPDCSDSIQPGSFHAHLSGLGIPVSGSKDPAGICYDGSTVNIQNGENMTVRSHCSNDMAGTLVSPDITLVQQNLDISGYVTGFNNCSSDNSVPFGHGSFLPTDATKQPWKNMASCDNLGKPFLGNFHLNSLQYENGQQIGSGLVDGSATSMPPTTAQSSNGYPVDHLSCINELPSMQLGGKMLDFKTTPSSGLFSNETGQIFEGGNSQRLSPWPNTQMPLNSMWTDTGFHFDGSHLIDNYSFSASTQNSNIIDGGIVDHLGNDLRVVGRRPTTAYGGNMSQTVVQRNVACSNNTSGKSGGWTGGENITGLQNNCNFSMDGEPNQSRMSNMREVSGIFQKSVVDVCSTASNADISDNIANDRTKWSSQFDRRFLTHQSFIVNKEPSIVTDRLTRHPVSKPCGVRPNSLNGNSVSGFQSASNHDSHGKTIHQGMWKSVALSKEHKQLTSPSLPPPNLNPTEPDGAYPKGQMSFSSQGLSASSVKAVRKDANIFSSVNLENNLKSNLPRSPYLPTVTAFTQPAFASAPPVGKPAPMSIRSHTPGALNNTATIFPSSRVVGQGTLGRQSVPMGVKSHDAGALKDAAVYYPPSTGFPQAAGIVIKESKTPAVPQMSATGQINRLPIQQSPQLPRVSTPVSRTGCISGDERTRAKRICLEIAKTATLPVTAPKITVPVRTPGLLGPSTAGRIAPNFKRLPTEHDKKLDHITHKDFTVPVKIPLGARCDLCTNDLMFLPKGSSTAYNDDLPMSAVMACRHSFHVSCLEEVGCSTERNKDPPCPLCGSPK